MPKKNYFDFSLFDEVGDAMDLFANTVRNAFEYDSIGDKTIFEAIVITPPTPLAVEELNAFLSIDPGEDSLNNPLPKFAFKARIIGANSPHLFLPNPCNPRQAVELQRQQNIQDVIDMHTTVIAFDAVNKPDLGDIVKIRINPGTFSVNVQNAEFVGIVSNDNNAIQTILKSSGQVNSCTKFQLQNAFKGYTGDVVGASGEGFQKLLDKLPDTDSNKVIEGAGLSGNLTNIVQAQLDAWGGQDECAANVAGLLSAYWGFQGVTFGAGATCKTAWSAVFISYVVSLEDSQFPKKQGHLAYSNAAANSEGGWSAWKTSGAKVKAQIGDIFVYPSPTEKNPDGTHGDVVYKIESNKAILAGGNLSNTAKSPGSLNIDKDGNYASFSNYQIVLKKGGLAKEVS